MSDTLIENRQVAICLPFYKTTNPRTAFALLSMVDRKRMSISLDFGDAAIWHSRNKLADNFLRSGLEWSLWVDDDMLPPFGNASLFNSYTGFDLPDKFAGMHGIDRLLSHSKTLVGGLYRGRWPQGRPVFAEGPRLEKWVNEQPRDEIRQTEWLGFGFILVHKTVFLDIEKTFPDLARKPDGNGGQWFSPSEHDLVKSVDAALKSLKELSSLEEAQRILEEGLRLSRRRSGLGVGEDVVFSRRAAQAGHQPFIDLGCICGHLGDYMYGFPRIKKVL